jgi:LysR family transcriptional regulator, regulator for genes of the gallate degradation pathway
MAVELRRLRYLVEAIEQGSLGKAAGRLGISQPALTKSLRLLEQELEVPLLERTSAGVAPTEYGRSLYAHAKAVDAEIDHACAEIGQLRGKQQVNVHVGSLPSIAGGILARAVAAVSEQHPQFSARIVEKMNFELLPGLRRAEYDFVLGLADDRVELGIHARVILNDELAVIARAGHPLAGRGVVRAAELAAFPWLFPMVGASHRYVLEQFFRSAGVEPPVAKIETTSVQMIKSVVLHSDHIGVLPMHVMEVEMDEGRLIRLPVQSETLRRRIAIYHRERHPLSPAARALMRAIEATCARVPQQTMT